MARRAQFLMASNQHSRTLVGFSGVPGSGKSTAAQHVVGRLNAAHDKEIATVLPMDGFHYRRSELDLMANPADAHARRGAAFTFDAPAFVDCVRRIAHAEDGDTVRAPSFDHAAGDPVADDIAVLPQHRFVLVEGLYVLRNELPWTQLEDVLLESWMLQVDEAYALAQVVHRQVLQGASAKAATVRAMRNDKANGDEVRRLSRPAAMVLDTTEAHARAHDELWC